MIEKLFPVLERLTDHLSKKIEEFKDIIKVGRTHLQDAVPIPLSLEFEVYRKQIETSLERLRNSCDELYYIPIGGTALGTGLNTHKNFAERTVSHLSQITKLPLKVNPVKAEGIASHNTIAKVSGDLRSLALSLIKMANDIRLMGSGPRAGLSELILPQNEPGSSIMPGKVNPTQSEALIQVCLQVCGNDHVISFGEAYGSILDLNVCKPIIIVNFLKSIEILIGGINSFIDHCLIDLEVNRAQINKQLQRAYKEGKTCKKVIKEMDLKIDNLDDLLDPKKMV
jgi:fumarate hydratase class II